MSELNKIFTELKSLIEKNSENLTVKDKYTDSKAKDQKPALHLYGSKKVSILGKKPEQTYIAGVIQQKNYVSFYFSPIYSHPDDFSDIDPELKKYLKGKSCFNLTKFNDHIKEELNEMLQEGIEKYKEIDWI